MPRLTKEAKSEIKHYKKWYERIEVSRHLAEYQGEGYHYVLFLNIFGVPKGAMMVSENGTVPDINLAKSLVFRISSYNNIMKFAIEPKDGMKDILKRPYGMMRTIEKQVKGYFGECNDAEHPLFEELNLLLNMCDTIYNNQVKFVDMYRELCGVSDEQERKKLLKQSTFDRLYEIFIEWHVLLYKEQRMQLTNYYDLPKILRELEGAKGGEKLFRSLRNMHTDKRRKIISKFIEGVIEKNTGDISDLTYSAKDIDRFRELKIKEGYQMFNSRLLPHIRN